MNLKPLQIPERVLKDEALKRRLPATHPKMSGIEQDYQNRMNGYLGEKSMEYYFDKLPQDEYDIIHDLRLPCINSDTFFQIDNLVMTTSINLPIEVKNLSGDIHFEKNLNQVIRTFHNQSKGRRVQNPVLQVREQAFQLKKWLKAKGFENIPVEYLFVNSNNSSITTTDSGNEQILNRISTSETLIDKIHQFCRIREQTSLKKSTLRKIQDALLAAHTPKVIDILKIYNILISEILLGVHCPKCFAIPMFYKNGAWYCYKCDYKTKTAPIYTLNDYFLLIKPTITNAEFRWFFQISSPKIANKILKQFHLPETGSNKGRIYHKPEKFFLPDE